MRASGRQARNRREPIKSRCAYRGQSPDSLPVSIGHRFGGSDKRDRGASERVARACRGGGGKRKDDDFDGFAATKRDVAECDDAILGQSSFSAVCLHGGRIKRL